MIALAYSTKHIASHLQLSVKTIEKHPLEPHALSSPFRIRRRSRYTQCGTS